MDRIGHGLGRLAERSKEDRHMTQQGEIVEVDTEREIIYQELCDEIAQILSRTLNPDLTIGEDARPIASMAVTGVLRSLRVLSGRRLAVLLADRANRHEGWVIREPARYTPEQIENVS